MWLLDRMLRRFLVSGELTITDHDGAVHRFGSPSAEFEPVAPQASADPVVRALEPLLAAEFAVQSGRLDDAARWYLEAARAAQDVDLAERATRIALLAQDDARAAKSRACRRDGPIAQ